MSRKCVAALVCVSLGAGQAAAQFTISIPGVTNSRSGLRIRPQVVVPITGARRPQLPPPNQASGYSGNMARIDENRRRQLAAWEQAAEKGDLTAAYHVGRAFEMGAVSYPSRAPDMGEAVNWYNRAVRGGNLNAMYHLGALMATRNVFAVDRSGVARPNVLGGRKMMDYAVQHGYQPATDTVRAPEAASDNTAGLVAGSLVALILIGALANAGSSGGAANPDNSGASSSPSPIDEMLSRVCTIKDRLNSTEDHTVYRTGYGYECS